MNSLQQIFEKKSTNLLSIFFTAGFPKLDDTTTIISELSQSGVDFIEVGLPYSDPLADGTTIQNSSAIALKNGMNLDVVFEQLLSIKETNSTPLVIMGYFNQMIKYGEEAFCEKLKACNIDTVIIPDLPMIEYENHYQKLFKKHSINNVFLITPHTSEERIRKIDDLTESFIYVVASASITGVKQEVSKEQVAYFDKIKKMKLKSKLVVGFGISDHQTFTTACNYANGAIIGSAYIKYLNEKGVLKSKDFVRSVVEG